MKRVRIKLVGGNSPGAIVDRRLQLSSDASIEFPPGFTQGRGLTPDQVVTAFAEFGSSVGASLVAAYLMKALESGQIKELFIRAQGRYELEEILKALEAEDDN